MFKNITLTPRVTKVLKWAAHDMSSQEITYQLSISIRTVTTQMRNTLDKLSSEN